MEEKERREIKEIMKEAEKCHAWTVAIMIAKLLGDEESANKFIDELLNMIKWRIPFVEREEKLEEERQKIRSQYL